MGGIGSEEGSIFQRDSQQKGRAFPTCGRKTSTYKREERALQQLHNWVKSVSDSYRSLYPPHNSRGATQSRDEHKRSIFVPLVSLPSSQYYRFVLPETTAVDRHIPPTFEDLLPFTITTCNAGWRWRSYFSILCKPWINFLYSVIQCDSP